MQHFFSEKKIDKTTLPGRKAEYDIHFIRDHKQLQVPFFPKKDRPFFSLFFQESGRALFLETGICKKSNKASILFQAISFTLIPSTAREIII